MVLAGSRFGIGRKTEAEFEMDWQPVGFGRGYSLQPAAKIGAEVFDFALPDPRNGGSEFVFIACPHAIQYLIRNV